jgi:DNA-directed RNA polymerase subunit RPC12/RpoP
MKSDERRAQRSNAERSVERVADVLRRWDPMGVDPGAAGPADEYDGYAPMLVELASKGASVDELAQHLGILRAAMMGVRGDAASDRSIASAVVAALDAPAAAARTPQLSAHPQRRDSSEGSYICPSCSEEIVVPLDPTEGDTQRYVEDCPVCCHPIVIHVEFLEGDEPPRVSAEAE